MVVPSIQISNAEAGLTDWISAIAAIVAALAAALAIWVARKDLRESHKKIQAQTTYQIHKDILDFVSGRDGKSNPQEKLLFYYSMFNLIEANLLHPGLETMVKQDLKAAGASNEFQTFWDATGNRRDYPMDFQNFISENI